MKGLPSMLAIVTDAYGGRGGIAQYNRDFLGASAESGILSSITVLPRQTPDPPEPPRGIRQLRAHAGRVGYSIAALRTALVQPFDLVFCGHLFMAPLAVLIARFTGAKLIVQTHGIEAWHRPSRTQRAALEQADLVLSVSRHTRAAVLSWAAIGLEGKRALLTVGRMHARERYKGHDRMFAAIPELVKKGYDICYLVVGEGDDRPRLEALAVQVGVSDRVKFLGAAEPRTLLETYRAADLFIMPSTGEGFGVSFLEAMASGTPALGLDVAGAQDALGGGELGTAISEAKLTAAIARVLEQPKPDAFKLAAAVRARFGRERFKGMACLALNRLIEVDAGS